VLKSNVKKQRQKAASKSEKAALSQGGFCREIGGQVNWPVQQHETHYA
jgi:hypothetical protein